MAKNTKKLIARMMAIILCLNQLMVPVSAETTESTPETNPAETVQVSVAVEVQGETVIIPDAVESSETQENGSFISNIEGETVGESGETISVEIEESGSFSETSYTEEINGTEYNVDEFSGEFVQESTVIVEESSSEETVISSESVETFDTTPLNSESAETMEEETMESTVVEGEWNDVANETTSVEYNNDYTETDGTVTSEAVVSEVPGNIEVGPLPEAVTTPEGTTTEVTKSSAELEFIAETTVETTTVTETGSQTNPDASQSTLNFTTYTGKNLPGNKEYIAIQVGNTYYMLDDGGDGKDKWLTDWTYDASKISIKEGSDTNGPTFTINVPLEGKNNNSSTTLNQNDFAAMGIDGEVTKMVLNSTKSKNSGGIRYDNVILDMTVTVRDSQGNETTIDIINGVPVTDSYKVLVEKENVIPEKYLDGSYDIVEETNAAGEQIGWSVTPKAEAEWVKGNSTSTTTDGEITYSTENGPTYIANAEMDAEAAKEGSNITKVEENGMIYYKEVVSSNTTVSNPITGQPVALTDEEIALYAVADSTTGPTTTYAEPTAPTVPQDVTHDDGTKTAYELVTSYNEDGTVASYQLIEKYLAADGTTILSSNSETFFGTTTTVETLTVTNPTTKEVTTVTKTTVEVVKNHYFMEYTREEYTEQTITSTRTDTQTAVKESFILDDSIEGNDSMYFEFNGTMYPVEDKVENDNVKITDVESASVSISNKSTTTTNAYDGSISISLSNSLLDRDDIIAEVTDANGNILGTFRLSQNDNKWSENLADALTDTKMATYDSNKGSYTLTGLTLPNGAKTTVTLVNATVGTTVNAKAGNAADVAASNGALLSFQIEYTANTPTFKQVTTTTTSEKNVTSTQTATKTTAQEKVDMKITGVETTYTVDRDTITVNGVAQTTKTTTSTSKAAQSWIEKGFEEIIETTTEPEETTTETTEPETTTEPEETTTAPEEETTAPEEETTAPEEETTAPEDETTAPPEETTAPPAGGDDDDDVPPPPPGGGDDEDEELPPPPDGDEEEEIVEDDEPDVPVEQDDEDQVIVEEEGVPMMLFIEDEEVPLNDEPAAMNLDEEEDEELVILDEEVPLADAPKTGDVSLLWAAFSGMSLGGMVLVNKKREEDEEV